MTQSRLTCNISYLLRILFLAVAAAFVLHRAIVLKTIRPLYTPQEPTRILNAFHYKAVEHLLPYWDKMENVSWYYSAVYNIVWNEIVFRG